MSPLPLLWIADEQELPYEETSEGAISALPYGIWNMDGDIKMQSLQILR